MYLLFLFDDYYPCGGMNDFDGDFPSLEEALDRAKNSGRDYYQVSKNSVVVADGYCEDL